MKVLKHITIVEYSDRIIFEDKIKEFKSTFSSAGGFKKLSIKELRHFADSNEMHHFSIEEKVFTPSRNEKIKYISCKVIEEERSLILNQIQLHDDTILKSLYRHNFVEYNDKEGNRYFLDGGRNYARYGYSDNAPKFKDITIYSDDDFDTIRENLHLEINYEFILLKDIKISDLYLYKDNIKFIEDINYADKRLIEKEIRRRYSKYEK